VYRVDLRRNAQKTLEKIRTPEYSRIIETLLELEKKPRPRGTEKIRGTELWRVRKGDYRIIYVIDDENKVITIVRIGHRREIYRGL
jgi:mRNA interferase RelE/StbE